MMKRFLTGLILAGGLAMTASADVVIRVGPPRAIVERRGPPPGAGYVWVQGYHRWDGERHVWVEGRWDRPPHPHARWEAHRWAKRRGGWVLIEGHWR